MIVLVGSQKGGCGKSTMAVNFAVERVKRSHKVCLVDADRQGTATNWAMDRSDTQLTEIPSVQAYDNITDTLTNLNDQYDYVLVDAAGRDSRELRTGMSVADTLIIPFRPSQPDLDTLPALSKIIEQAKALNPKLFVCAVLTMASTNPSVHEIQEAQAYFEDYADVRLAQSVIYDRKVYRDAMSEGKGVVEMKNVKAVNEMMDLAQEIFQ